MELDILVNGRGGSGVKRWMLFVFLLLSVFCCDVVDTSANSRWEVLREDENLVLSIDALTFSSNRQVVDETIIYTAQCWLQLESKKTDKPFKFAMRHLEIRGTFTENPLRVNLEMRILEDYGYDADGKEVAHELYDKPQWKAVAPDSGDEQMIYSVIDWDKSWKKNR